MAKKRRTYAASTRRAAKILGGQISMARRARGWTIEELAERTGVSARTMSSIEHGVPTVALGSVLEAALIAGVELYDVPGDELGPTWNQMRGTLALLPSQVRRKQAAVDDDF